MKGKSKKESLDSPILLIDCSNLSYAALYSFGHLSYRGKETGIIYGFLKQVLSLGIKFKTNRFIFCWDAGVTYRHLAYSQYKAKRHIDRESDPEKKKMHDSLLAQNHIMIHYLLPSLGFKNNFIKSWYEADDLLAYWANKLQDKKLIMVTSDTDMYQCLDCCDIWSPIKKEMITKKTFIEIFKIQPRQWALAKAIGGCSGDNVVGIKGVSDPKKSSSKALLYIQGKLKPGKIKDRIESKEGQEIIKRNIPLVTAPYRENLLKRMFFKKDCFSKRKFTVEFDKLRFDSFLEGENLKNWEKIFLKGNNKC